MPHVKPVPTMNLYKAETLFILKLLTKLIPSREAYEIGQGVDYVLMLEEESHLREQLSHYDAMNKIHGKI